ALLALPAALAAPFVAIGDPPLRSHSAVALVPGCLVALAAAVAAVIGTMLVSDDVERGLSIAYQQLVSVLTSYTMPFLPIAVVLSAALGGARTPEATAAVAAPTLLGCFYALMSETSIGKVLAATLIPGLVGAAATAVCYAFAPGRAVTPWL